MSFDVRSLLYFPDPEEERKRSQAIDKLLENFFNDHGKKLEDFILEGYCITHPSFFQFKKKKFLNYLVLSQGIGIVMATLVDELLRIYKAGFDTEQTQGRFRTVNRTFWKFDASSPIFRDYRLRLVRLFNERIKTPEEIKELEMVLHTLVVAEEWIKKSGLKQIGYSQQHIIDTYLNKGLQNLGKEILEKFSSHFEKGEPDNIMLDLIHEKSLSENK